MTTIEILRALLDGKKLQFRNNSEYLTLEPMECYHGEYRVVIHYNSSVTKDCLAVNYMAFINSHPEHFKIIE